LSSGSVGESLLTGFNEMRYKIFYGLSVFWFVIPFVVGVGELIAFGDDA
jgi:hypothetical protein